MTTPSSDPPSTAAASPAPPAAPAPAIQQLAPLLTFPPSTHVTAYITSAAAPLNTLIGWFHLPPTLADTLTSDDDFAPELGPPRHVVTSRPAKWILHGQPSLHPPSVHACCAPKSLLPTSTPSSCAPDHNHAHNSTSADTHDPDPDPDEDGPAFYDVLVRPPTAPPTCAYLVRNVYRYPGDNLVLTREYPDFVARTPGASADVGGGAVKFEFDCAVMHDHSAGTEGDGEGSEDKVYRSLAALADKVGAPWVCCEGRLVVERVPLVARVAAVGADKEE